jgi:hypothetical protein
MTSIGFTEIIVTGQSYSGLSSAQFQNKTFQIFQIQFIGQNGNRNEEIIKPDQNNLIMNGSDISTLTSSIIKHGSPINTEAIQIPKSTSPPNIIFQPTSQTSPLFLGNFKVGDVAPIWIQRTSTTTSPNPMASVGAITVAIRGTDNGLF